MDIVFAILIYFINKEITIMNEKIISKLCGLILTYNQIYN